MAALLLWAMLLINVKCTIFCKKHGLGFACSHTSPLRVSKGMDFASSFGLVGCRWMLAFLIDTARSLGIPLWIFNGSLISAIREGAHMPHDADMVMKFNVKNQAFFGEKTCLKFNFLLLLSLIVMIGCWCTLRGFTSAPAPSERPASTRCSLASQVTSW